MVKKIDTHIVVKKEDVLKYLSDEQQEQFGMFLGIIDAGRLCDGKSMDNKYYIVNTDESYAEEIYKRIEYYENEKDPEYRRMRDYYRGEYA